MLDSPSGQSSHLRTFIAINIPPEIGESISKLIEPIPELKDSNLNRLHMTLHFMGKVTPKFVSMLQEELKKIQVPPFKITVKGLGIFRHGEKQVIWAGVNESEFLNKLHQEILKTVVATKHMYTKNYSNTRDDNNLLQLELKPHITIRRLKNEKVYLISRFIKQNADYKFGEAEVKSFVFNKSVQKGPRFEHILIQSYELTIKEED
jgi:2'-5' RNA ligase